MNPRCAFPDRSQLQSQPTRDNGMRAGEVPCARKCEVGMVVNAGKCLTHPADNALVPVEDLEEPPTRAAEKLEEVNPVRITDQLDAVVALHQTGTHVLRQLQRCDTTLVEGQASSPPGPVPPELPRPHRTYRPEQLLLC